MNKRLNWNPFRQLKPLSLGLNDLKNKNFIVPSWMNETKATSFNMQQPRIDIIESDTAYLMQFDFIGTKKKDIQVKLSQGSLTIFAKRVIGEEDVSNRIYNKDDSNQVFNRTLVIPLTINLQKAEAHFNNGLLKITLPKQGEDEERELKIK